MTFEFDDALPRNEAALHLVDFAHRLGCATIVEVGHLRPIPEHVDEATQHALSLGIHGDSVMPLRGSVTQGDLCVLALGPPLSEPAVAPVSGALRDTARFPCRAGVHPYIDRMVRRPSTRGQSFAQVVVQLGPAQPGAGQSAPIPNLALQPEFTDRGGVTWTRRGGLLTEKRLRKLMRDPSVRVLHDHLGETTEVSADGRQAFWQSAQELSRQSPYTQFTCSEFKSEEGHLLVVHEDC